MPLNAKNKGAEGEREAASFLNSLLPWMDAKRGRQFSGGEDSPDVTHNCPFIHIEVKRVEKPTFNAWAKQLTKDQGKRIGIIMYRCNRGEWWFCVRGTEVIALINKLQGFLK